MKIKIGVKKILQWNLNNCDGDDRNDFNSSVNSIQSDDLCRLMLMMVVSRAPVRDHVDDYLGNKHNVALRPIPKIALSMDDSLYLLLALHPIRAQMSAVVHHHFCYLYCCYWLNRRFSYILPEN